MLFFPLPFLLFFSFLLKGRSITSSRPQHPVLRGAIKCINALPGTPSVGMEESLTLYSIQIIVDIVTHYLSVVMIVQNLLNDPSLGVIYSRVWTDRIICFIAWKIHWTDAVLCKSVCKNVNLTCISQLDAIKGHSSQFDVLIGWF